MSFHSFRGQRSGKPLKSRNFSQASTRHDVHSFDQHGRRHTWPAENESGFPCGLIMPDFWAPFHPDPQYLIINPDNTTELYIDWRALARDRRAALRSYHNEAIMAAADNKWPAPKVGEYSSDIIGKLGRPPRAFQLALAAEQGNPWVLGRTETPDPRLVEFLETTSSDIETALEEFDFSERSYRHAVAGAPRSAPKAPAKPPQKFRSFAEMKAAQNDDLDALETSDNIDPALAGETVTDGLSDEAAAIEETEAATSDFDAFDSGNEEIQEVESLPTEDEGAEASRAGDDEEALLDLQDEVDPGATGGQRIDPRKSDVAQRQQARRPSQTAIPRKRGAAASQHGSREVPSTRKGPKPFSREGKKSLADGARPVIGE